MGRFLTGVLALVVLGAIGGFVFLASWDMQPPTQDVEKVISNERFFAQTESKDELILR